METVFLIKKKIGITNTSDLREYSDELTQLNRQLFHLSLCSDTISHRMVIMETFSVSSISGKCF